MNKNRANRWENEVQKQLLLKKNSLKKMLELRIIQKESLLKGKFDLVDILKIKEQIIRSKIEFHHKRYNEYRKNLLGNCELVIEKLKIEENSIEFIQDSLEYQTTEVISVLKNEQIKIKNNYLYFKRKKNFKSSSFSLREPGFVDIRG